jgi:hypothetical protein
MIGMQDFSFLIDYSSCVAVVVVDDDDDDDDVERNVFYLIKVWNISSDKRLHQDNYMVIN